MNDLEEKTIYDESFESADTRLAAKLILEELTANADIETAEVLVRRTDLMEVLGMDRNSVLRGLHYLEDTGDLISVRIFGRKGKLYKVKSLQQGITTVISAGTKPESSHICSKEGAPVVPQASMLHSIKALDEAKELLDASSDFVGRLITEYMATRRALVNLVDEVEGKKCQ